MNLLGTAIDFTIRTSIQRLVLLGAIVIKIYTKATNVALDVQIITSIIDTSTYFQIQGLYSYSIYTILIYIVRE